MDELQTEIIRLLSETTTYPIETEGGTFEFIPQFIAIALVKKAFEKELGCNCCNADGNCKECGDAQKVEL